jgi:hypothetical protein
VHIGKGIRTQPLCSPVSAFKNFLTKTYVKRKYDRVNVTTFKWKIYGLTCNYNRDGICKIFKGCDVVVGWGRI